MKVTPPRPRAQPSEYFRFTPDTAEARATASDPVDLNPMLGDEPGAPYSERFRDVYFDRADGLAESRHVFLAGTGLPEAWCGRRQFTIGETGFGAGLNFLATWQLWRETAAADARLHYLSVERYPLTPDELRCALAPFASLQGLVRELSAVLPPHHAGFHRVWLDGDRVALTLMVGDAADVLSDAEVPTGVECWFLDGFAPARNPAMWSPAVFGELARLSAPGARLATFTVAGSVRRGLKEAGFAVEKSPGFASKREMTKARYQGTAQPSRIPPWFRDQHSVPPPAPAPALPRRVAIIGGGIAGAAIAYALARRGVAAVILERQPDLASEASGNPVALLAPRLSAADSAQARFYDRAWRMASDHLREAGFAWDRCGLLRIAQDGDAARMEAMGKRAALWPGSVRMLTPAETSEKSGIALTTPGVWCAEAGLVDPRALTRRLAARAECLTGYMVTALTAESDGWRVHEADGERDLSADMVVLAAGGAAGGLAMSDWLALEPVAGQLSILQPTALSAPLKSVLSWGGYLTPAQASVSGAHCLGATYERGDGGFQDFDAASRSLASRSPTTTEAAHQRILTAAPDAVRALLQPASDTAPDTGAWQSRTGVRAVTPDRLPLVGPLVAEPQFRADFARLRHGPTGRFPVAPALWKNLFVLSGLGSHGVMTAALSAEILVCRMLGEPWPVERRVALALDPARFLVRELRGGGAGGAPDEKPG